MIHGSIYINDRPIIQWQAVRRTNVHSAVLEPDDVSVYECRVSRLDRGSRVRTTGPAWEDTLTHRYGDGAEYLAARILIASQAGREDE